MAGGGEARGMCYKGKCERKSPIKAMLASKMRSVSSRRREYRNIMAKDIEIINVADFLCVIAAVRNVAWWRHVISKIAHRPV